MSRWFPDALQIALAPDQVVVEDLATGWHRLGPKPRILRRQVLPTVGEPGRMDWAGALRVLRRVLEAQDQRYCDVTVILANSFVRYALVPQSNLLSADQETSVLRHCFHEIYGAAAEHWELRLSAASGMPLQPATGVDCTLLDELRTLFPGDRLRLRSIQPRLMAVCNQHRAALSGGPSWLLLAEPGTLCLGLIADGGLTRLRSMRSGHNWAAELPTVLEREACLAELDETPGDLLLWHRDGPLPDMLDAGSLRLHLLQDPLPVETAAVSEDLAIAGS